MRLLRVYGCVCVCIVCVFRVLQLLLLTRAGVCRRGAGRASRGNDGKGWICVQDPASGQDYFFNTSSGQTSWERPAEAPHLPEPRPLWSPQTDSNGNTFYFNPRTQKSVWMLPEGAMVAKKPAVPPPPA